MPSDTEMVPNIIGKPPAFVTPIFEAFARRSSERLHGVISFHEEAIPICGLTQSSSVIPTARNMPRAGARSMPSVTICDRGFIGFFALIRISYLHTQLISNLYSLWPRCLSSSERTLAASA